MNTPSLRWALVHEHGGRRIDVATGSVDPSLAFIVDPTWPPAPVPRAMDSRLIHPSETHHSMASSWFSASSML